MRVDRRDFLRLTGAGFLTPYVIVAKSAHGARRRSRRTASRVAAGKFLPEVFDLSVASGDPSPTGAVLWTRINPLFYRPHLSLEFEVAEDADFQSVVVTGLVAARDISPSRDYTVHVDLDGQLAPNRHYYYRFEYRHAISRTGRLRTLPAPGEDVERLRLGVISCQDYTNGYYGALAHLAEEDVDYVVHLGDFIYETVGDPSFQPLPLDDRLITLPGGLTAATSLEDYRFLYRTYRSDPWLQRLLERHTVIVTIDDHETANDAYWDYSRHTLGAPDHPFTTDPQFGNDPALLRQLKFDSQRAWAEYVPAWVEVNEAAQHPHEFLSVFRRFTFGTLLDLFMADERTYRTEPPCGVDERNFSAGCPAQQGAGRTMLGLEQRAWLIDGVRGSPALWKAWGNPVFLGALTLGRLQEQLYFSLDAWDGYELERRLILQQLKDGGVDNLIVLTGDLHSYMGALVKLDYRNRSNDDSKNLVGVEFMTPAVTSSNIAELLLAGQTSELSQLLNSPAVRGRTAGRFGFGGTPPNLFEKLVRQTNPHVRYFNSQRWGYSIVEFTQTDCTYSAYSVDKFHNSPAARKELLQELRVPVGEIKLEEV